MFKAITTAAVFALTAAATPVLADESKPYQFGKTVEDALSFLTITGNTPPATRDAQICHDRAHGRKTRNTATPARNQVFLQDGIATSRSVNGLRGFDRTGLGRIDR